jgi:hypothetical protein
VAAPARRAATPRADGKGKHPTVFPAQVIVFDFI